MCHLAKQHNWLIFRIINPALKERLSRFAHGRVLDLGCGEQPYRTMIRELGAEYCGIDHRFPDSGQGRPHIPASAYAIPFKDECMDTLLCTDVLEHLEEPGRALEEAYRALAPGGWAVFTVPLYWHIHEAPRDFFRYTRYGLRYLLESAGFSVIEIASLTGFSATFGQELVYFLYRFRKGGWLNPLWWLIPPLGHVIQALALIANRFERTRDFSAEYMAVARKPEESPG